MKYKCPDCGRINLSMYCDTCNKGLSSTCAVDSEILSSERGTNTLSVDTLMERYEKKKVRVRIMLIIIAAVLLLFVLVAVNSFGNQSFTKLFPDYVTMSWCTMSSDGTWMKLDTNPFNFSSAYSSEAWRGIEKANTKLGFSSAINEKMRTTTWGMGRQTESNDKYTVSWTFHPDQGLEVLYEMKK